MKYLNFSKDSGSGKFLADKTKFYQTENMKT